MRIILAIMALIGASLLAGCASTTIGLRTTNSPSMPGSAAPPGSSYSSVAIQADVSPNAYFGLVFLGYVMAGIQDNYLRWSRGSSWHKPPALAEGRAIVEQDCSQPLERPHANLRCK